MALADRIETVDGNTLFVPQANVRVTFAAEVPLVITTVPVDLENDKKLNGEWSTNTLCRIDVTMEKWRCGTFTMTAESIIE